MKKYYIVLIVFFGIINLELSSQTCNVGNLNCSTQAQVDAFATNYPGCTNIIGNVSFSGSSIANLNAFNNVTSITGNLTLNSMNNSAGDYSGLNNLIEVNGTLSIQSSNFAIPLISLSKVNGPFTINNSLASDYNNLTKVSGQLWLNNIYNSNLTSFQNLDTVSIIYIYNNNNLVSVTGFQGLDTINLLNISSNFNLTNISGFDYLFNIDSIRIVNNFNLSNCNIEPVCEKVWTSKLNISNNNENCENIEQVKAICPLLPDLDNDGIPNDYDNCVANFNPDQSDIDNDNIGNVCDADFDYDQDGILNGVDNCPFISNTLQIDSDMDGIGDECELDILCSGNKLFTLQSELNEYGTVYGECETFNGNIIIELDYNNSGYNNLNGLNKLKILNGNLFLRSYATTNYNGIKNLKLIDGSLEIYINEIVNYALDSGLVSLDKVAGDLIVKSNKTSNFFPTLDSIGGNLFLSKYNQNFGSLFLQSLDYIGADISLLENGDLRALQNLDTINGSLYIRSFENTMNNSLNNLKHINGDFKFEHLYSNLSTSFSFNSFNGLRSINGSLIINNNPSITSILGFQNLNTINSNLIIINNKILNNLSGLDHNLQTDSIIIKNNFFLSECEIQPICEKAVMGGLIVNSNGIPCNTVQAIQQSCPQVLDSDGDTINDLLDNCPNNSNTDQADANNDGVGNVCDSNSDSDNDTVIDSLDNCVTTFNPNQADINNDGEGDVCDNNSDSDNDGRNDNIDNCPSIFNPDQRDCNNNGIGDVCEAFADNDCDGVANGNDNCPDLYNPYQIDYNNNNIGDACENFPKVGFNTTQPKTEMHLSYSNLYLDHPEKGLIVKGNTGLCYKTTVEIINNKPELKLVQITCP